MKSFQIIDDHTDGIEGVFLATLELLDPSLLILL